MEFNEEELRRALGRLPTASCVAFSACCAERLLGSLERFTDLLPAATITLLRDALAAAWNGLDDDASVFRERLALLSTRIDAAIEAFFSAGADLRENDPSGRSFFADDALAAVAYTLRTATGNSGNAVFAARRAYDALDAYVIDQERVDVADKAALARVEAHPLVQAEFGRQSRDLQDLLDMASGRGAITFEELRRRARSDATYFVETRD